MTDAMGIDPSREAALEAENSRLRRLLAEAELRVDNAEAGASTAAAFHQVSIAESRRETRKAHKGTRAANEAAGRAAAEHEAEMTAHHAEAARREGLYAALHSSEGRLRLILESASEFAIFTTDLDGRVTEWNPGASNILGWEGAEMLGQDVRIIWTPEDRQAGVPEEEMRLAREKGQAEDERWHLRRDGSRFWATGELMVMRDEAGELVGYLKVLRDRTEQLLAGEALEILNERYRLAQRATRDAVWDWSFSDNCLLWNEALEEVYGWTSGQVEPSGDWWLAKNPS